MRTLSASCVVSLLVLVGPARADEKAITIELKDFKFKVPEAVESLFTYDENGERLSYYTNGAAEAVVKVPADGEYEIVVKAACDPAQDEKAKFKVTIDGVEVGKETLLTADEPKEYTITAKLKAGERKLAVAFTNDAYKENEYDRNFYVHGVTLKKK
jgi:hypothetical protein